VDLRLLLKIDREAESKRKNEKILKWDPQPPAKVFGVRVCPVMSEQHYRDEQNGDKQVGELSNLLWSFSFFCRTGIGWVMRNATHSRAVTV